MAHKTQGEEILLLIIVIGTLWFLIIGGLFIAIMFRNPLVLAIVGMLGTLTILVSLKVTGTDV